jgi:hypothetical protein
MAKKTDKKKDANKSARKVRLGVTYDRTTHSWQLKHGRPCASELPPAGGSVPPPRQEGPASPEGAGTSVPTTTSSVYISPEHYHERVLDLYMAGALDAIDVVGRDRAILDLQAQAVSVKIADVRRACATALPELFVADRLALLRDDLPYTIFKTAKQNLFLDTGNLADQVSYFVGAYKKTSEEIGEGAAQGILGKRHLFYLNGSSDFVPTWRTFLALLEKHGIELRFPH